MTADLTGRTILLTGAAGGLGPVAAAAAVAAGAYVVLVDRSQPLVQAVAATLPVGSVAAVRAVDLLDEAATVAFAASLTDASLTAATSTAATSTDSGINVDAVWHLVGGWKGGKPVELQPLADWELLHDLTVRTTLHVVRAFTASLAAGRAAGRPGGRLLLVSSPQATKPTSDNAAYAAAKAAAEALVLAVADRFVGTGATANVVVVPAILTPAMAAANPDKPRPGFVPAAELAETLVYLTGSPAAARMNGQHVRLLGAEGL